MVAGAPAAAEAAEAAGGAGEGRREPVAVAWGKPSPGTKVFAEEEETEDAAAEAGLADLDGAVPNIRSAAFRSWTKNKFGRRDRTSCVWA